MLALGLFVNEGRAAPQLGDLQNPTEVSAGDYFSCALDDTGAVCWGRSAKGEGQVPPLSNPVSIASGGQHACAIDDGEVVCWGSSDSGRSTVPPGLSNPRSVTTSTARRAKTP